MANAPAARVCSFSSVVETPLVSASPIAGNGRRGGSSSIRALVAPSSSSSKALMPSDDTLDLQQEAMMIKVHTILHQRLRESDRESDREMLVAIDKLRRLCIDHYFQEEIKSAMGACVEALLHSNDLHDATLAFRLLREAGHDVSADELLQKFTDDDDGGSGEFSLALSKDIRGLLSLHDVSQLNVGGETLLYKAKEFSTKHLTSAIRYLEPSLAKYVRQALDHPYHRSLMQYKARHHLSYLQSLPAASRDTAMEELAVAEFQFNKQLHQIEMPEVKRWWMEVGLAHEIPVIRDQLLKWYMWAVTILPGGSSMSRYRIEITKIISFVYVVDDIFDVVGTPEELSRFTDAIKMWDIAAADSLPTYMRSCYKALYTVTNEIAEMAKQEHGFTNNPIDHLKKAWATLFDGFMVEARWLATDEVPRAEEYLRNGVVTSGVPLTFAHVLVLLGHGDDGASYKDAEKVVSCLAKILRLYDDLGSAEDEAQEGLDGSYRDFYLMENPSCTPADAEEHMRGLIAMEWEELNRECLGGRRSSLPSSFTQACLNGARMVSVMYGYNQEQRLPVLEDYMRTLLL